MSEIVRHRLNGGPYDREMVRYYGTPDTLYYDRWESDGVESVCHRYVKGSQWYGVQWYDYWGIYDPSLGNPLHWTPLAKPGKPW